MPVAFQVQASDGTILTAYRWLPETVPVKACIVLIHGVGEHARRYDEYASYFASLGLAVFGMDLRGHGQSPGKRGHTAPRKRVLEDIDLFCQKVSKEYPEKSVFIYGHSMGGNIGLSHRLMGAFRPKAYIITSPWILLHKKISRAEVLILKGVSCIKPDLLLRSGIKAMEISSDAPQVELYQKDALNHGFISVKTAIDCWDYALQIIKRSGEKLEELLLMHGTEDTICSIKGSRAFMMGAGSECTYEEWEGCRHELHHDKDRDRLKKTIANWILERA